jgi:hypothetical protein
LNTKTLRKQSCTKLASKVCKGKAKCITKVSCSCEKAQLTIKRHAKKKSPLSRCSCFKKSLKSCQEGDKACRTSFLEVCRKKCTTKKVAKRIFKKHIHRTGKKIARVVCKNKTGKSHRKCVKRVLKKTRKHLRRVSHHHKKSLRKCACTEQARLSCTDVHGKKSCRRSFIKKCKQQCKHSKKLHVKKSCNTFAKTLCKGNGKKCHRAVLKHCKTAHKKVRKLVYHKKRVVSHHLRVLKKHHGERHHGHHGKHHEKHHGKHHEKHHGKHHEEHHGKHHEKHHGEKHHGEKHHGERHHKKHHEKHHGERHHKKHHERHHGKHHEKHHERHHERKHHGKHHERKHHGKHLKKTFEIAQNVIPQNEIAQNEIAQNEIAQNEIAQNEIAQNEIAQNEIAQNEIPQNEIAQNEIVQNEQKVWTKKVNTIDCIGRAITKCGIADEVESCRRASIKTCHAKHNIRYTQKNFHRLVKQVLRKCECDTRVTKKCETSGDQTTCVVTERQTCVDRCNVRRKFLKDKLREHITKPSGCSHKAVTNCAVDDENCKQLFITSCKANANDRITYLNTLLEQCAGVSVHP